MGTLTLLFSDIEGSTSMLKRLGDRWGEALSAQRSILRAVFAEHEGHEMGTEGDSFFVVFPSAQHALRAAVGGQRRLHRHAWPDGVPLRVRMGLHTGEPQRHEDGYIGIDVHRAARIAATAAGGQTILSASTQALVGSQQHEVRIRDLGWHRLKDIADPEHLFEVVDASLPQAFPPLRSLGTTANLPAYTTELIGRSVELTELSDVIERGVARLLTLTGPGGTGKTRLAVAVARELSQRFPRDIFFVGLHTADRSALMWSAIADAVGAPGDVAELPHVRVLRFLGDRTSLLILDNLEQIPDADAVVGQLLKDAPGVQILTTSRRPLHLVDEQLFPVPALALPEPGRSIAGEAGSVQLFVRRARMVSPDFGLTIDNAADVAALCRRLDGLPLAIELAAARSRILSPRALLNRIDGRLGQGVTAADRTERQRTLGATVAWSYDLLDETAQRTFRQLGVFSSQADLEAIEHVMGAEDGDPLDAVAHLVDVSLLHVVEGPDGEPVVAMLETIRQFARERLRMTGEYDETRLRHAHWCVEMAADIASLLGGPTQMNALDRMDAVEEDIRAALDWCLLPEPVAAERRECAYALLESMNPYWYRFGYIAEGRGWQERALRIIENDPDADSTPVVEVLHGLGVLALQQNDLTTGSRMLERALDMARRLGDVDREARESNSLGIARRDAGDTNGARALIERSILLARQVNNPHREAIALTNVVTLHMDAGDYAAAVDAGRRAVAADRALDDPWGVAISQCNLVLALLNAEGPAAAYRQLEEVARGAVALGDTELSIDVLESFAAVWASLGDGERAAALLGASDNQRESTGMPRTAPDRAHLDRFLAPARTTVPPDIWNNAYAVGKTLSIEAAVCKGLAEDPAERTLATLKQDP